MSIPINQDRQLNGKSLVCRFFIFFRLLRSHSQLLVTVVYRSLITWDQVTPSGMVAFCHTWRILWGIWVAESSDTCVKFSPVTILEWPSIPLLGLGQLDLKNIGDCKNDPEPGAPTVDAISQQSESLDCSPINQVVLDSLNGVVVAVMDMARSLGAILLSAFFTMWGFPSFFPPLWLYPPKQFWALVVRLSNWLYLSHRQWVTTVRLQRGVWRLLTAGYQNLIQISEGSSSYKFSRPIWKVLKRTQCVVIGSDSKLCGLQIYPRLW